MELDVVPLDLPSPYRPCPGKMDHLQAEAAERAPFLMLQLDRRVLSPPSSLSHGPRVTHSVYCEAVEDRGVGVAALGLVGFAPKRSDTGEREFRVGGLS